MVNEVIRDRSLTENSFTKSNLIPVRLSQQLIALNYPELLMEEAVEVDKIVVASVTLPEESAASCDGQEEGRDSWGIRGVQ